VARKRLTFGQYTRYNLLSSKTHQSFPTVLITLVDFCRILPVLCCCGNCAFLPRLYRSKNWFSLGNGLVTNSGRHCITRTARGVSNLSLIRNGHCDGWQRHDKTLFLTPAAGSLTTIVTLPIRTERSKPGYHTKYSMYQYVVVCECACIVSSWSYTWI
jgi:hypothetical protein